MLAADKQVERPRHCCVPLRVEPGFSEEHRSRGGRVLRPRPATAHAYTFVRLAD